MTGERPNPFDFGAVDWPEIRRQAAALNSDGCSGPTLPIYVDCCLLHDIAYQTHCDEHGNPTTRLEQDVRFRECMQWFSPLGEASPVASWRYAAVRLLGWYYWMQRKPATPIKALFNGQGKEPTMDARQIPDWMKDAAKKAAEEHAAKVAGKPWWRWARRIAEILLRRTGTPR